MAPPTPPQLARRIGLVTFYHKRRKFGFIRDVFTGEIFFVHDSAIDYDPTQEIPRYKKALKIADYVEFVPASEIQQTAGKTIKNNNNNNNSPEQLTRVEYVTGVAGGPLRYQFMHQLFKERHITETEPAAEKEKATTEAPTPTPPTAVTTPIPAQQ